MLGAIADAPGTIARPALWNFGCRPDRRSAHGPGRRPLAATGEADQHWATRRRAAPGAQPHRRNRQCRDGRRLTSIFEVWPAWVFPIRSNLRVFTLTASA